MARIISEYDIQRVKALTKHISAESILPHIDESQDLIIRPLLRDDLYNELCTQIDSDTLTEANTALLAHVQQCHIYHAFARYVRWGNLQSTPTGIKKKHSDESEFPSGSEVSNLHATAKQDAEIYETRLLEYLNDNSANYPLWHSGNHYCGPGHNNSKSSYGIF